MTARAGWWRGAALLAGLGALLLLMVPFARYSAMFGAEGLGLLAPRETHLFAPEMPLSSGAIGAHMLAGAVITLLVPLQLIPWIRNRAPGWHRWSGRVIVVSGMLAGGAGLSYILARGAVGGWPMSLGFGIYGLCLIVCSAQALRHARAGRFDLHRDWALRTFWLAIGSWLYRVHYGLWYLLTDGLASRPDFSGAFDLVQNFAFYLPYLAALELYLRRRRRSSRAGF